MSGQPSDTGQNMPLFDAKNAEEKRRKKHDSKLAPAVEGMKKAHRCLFSFSRAGLDNQDASSVSKFVNYFYTE